jgi:membrane associated rhomboid family serine protease
VIFPYLVGLLSPMKAPITYLLLAINLAVFVGTYADYNKSDSQLDSFLDDDLFIATQGSAFAVMIQKEPVKFSETLRDLARSAGLHEKGSLEVLGGFAMRNTDFMSRAQTFSFGGDEVAVSHWRKRLKEFMAVQDHNPSYRWGLSKVHDNWINWFTYQFAHAGFSHLFWNMVFLLIFGCFVESQLGGSFVAIGYVGGGLIGALSYSMLSGISYSPLVGASGAITGLIGLVAVGWWRKEPLQFLYVLIPTKDYMGVARLPSWLLGLVYLLPDLSHYLASSKEVGSVAYSAHIGGASFGALIAVGVIAGVLPKKQTAPALQTPSAFTEDSERIAS